MKAPRWYRNGLVIWAAVGVPFLLVGVTFSNDRSWLIEPPAAMDPQWWVVTMALLYFPLTGMIAAVLQSLARLIVRLAKSSERSPELAAITITHVGNDDAKN